MRACSCIATIWMTTLFVSSPILFISQLDKLERTGTTAEMVNTTVSACYTKMENKWASFYYIIMVISFFFVPLLLLLMLYLVIGRRLVRDTNTAELHRKIELPNMKARRQVVVMLATVTIFFFICLLPFRVLSLWMIFDFERFKHISALKFHSLLYTTRLMLYLNSAINPILYNLTSTKFRDAFLKFFSRSTARDLLRQSTFTTGTSLSNGRTGSSRSSLTSHSPRSSLRASLQYCRQSSFDALSAPRRHILSQRYGRQGSFVTSNNSSSASAVAAAVALSPSGIVGLAGRASEGLPSPTGSLGRGVKTLSSKDGVAPFNVSPLATTGFSGVLPTLTEVSSGVVSTPSSSPQKDLADIRQLEVLLLDRASSSSTPVSSSGKVTTSDM